jgi:5-methylcytosine-specific restriction endonuclease McrA
MSLPRSCACGSVHRPGEPCPVARASQDRKRGTSTQRYGAGWGTISRRILRRDGHVCQLRLPGCTGTATTVDHRIPRSQGGTATESNLVAACRHCNSSKGARAA